MAEEAKVPTVPAPAVETHPDGAPVLKGAEGTAFWPTEEKAKEIAAKRIKGARRAFVVKDTKKGTTRYATAAHMHYVMQYLCETELGFEVTEVGKPAASKQPVTATNLLAAIDTLPEAEREAVKKQLEELLKAKIKK